MVVVSGGATYVDKSAPRIGNAIKHVNNWEGRATVWSPKFNLFICDDLGLFRLFLVFDEYDLFKCFKKSVNWLESHGELT